MLIKPKQGEFGETDDRLACYLDYTSETLVEATIRIARAEIVAAWFPGALPPDLCGEATRRITAHTGKSYYEGAEGVGRLGPVSLYETQFGRGLRVDYFRDAASNLAVSRSMFPESRYPLDDVRLWLDDGWPGKVGRLRLEDGTCALGLIRFLENASAILPHNDSAPSDVRDSLIAQGVDVQIAFNAMVQSAEKGGETRIYPKRLTRSEYDANRRPAPNDWALRAECLPPDPVVIRPMDGDIYLFDAGYPHEVAACSGDRARFTLSAFIGAMRDGSLTLFS